LLLKKLATMANGILAIRERERNQTLLAQYKMLVDQSAIVCKFTPAGRITYVNDKLCEISGYMPEDLLGHDFAALNHESEPPENAKNTLKQLRCGTRWTGIVRKRNRTGELLVVESSLVPILDEHGAVNEVVSLSVDVTEHYKVYENLVETLSDSTQSFVEQRHFFAEYKRALELGSCICVTDRKHRIISTNQGFEALIGYRAGELKGRHVSEIMPDVSADRCLDQVQQANKEHFASRTSRFLGSNGRELQFSVGFVGVHNVTGEVESIIMICQDITESTRLSREITDTQRELLFMLGEVVEKRSLETGQHIRRIAQVARFLAIKAGLSEEAADLIEMAAPMHDIGKVGIADVILNKPGKLNPAEFDEMKKHADIGFRILGKVERPLIGVAAAIAHEHHERFDGQGYPNGIRGVEISLEARIVSVADVLDALASSRSYKNAWNDQEIRAYFLAQRGLQFDPDLVDLLLAHWETVRALREETLPRNSNFGDFL
jgi:PAS domain S-box-containing protein